jgi:hypothetical protein
MHTLRGILFLLLAVCLGVKAQNSEIVKDTTKQNSDSNQNIETEFREFQLKKGKFYAGINFGVGLGFRSNSNSFQNTTALVEVYFAPRVGYFVYNRCLVGLNSEITTTVASFDYKTDYYLLSTTTGIFGRYYLKNGFFADAEYGLGKGTQGYLDGKTTRIENGFSASRVSVGIGAGSFWLKRVAFEILLKYSYVHAEADKNDLVELNSFRIVAGVGIAIGK